MDDNETEKSVTMDETAVSMAVKCVTEGATD